MGAVAVVIFLVYVGVNLEQNTRTLMLANHHALVAMDQEKSLYQFVPMIVNFLQGDAMTGILRLMASIAVVLVAGLAVLLVFDVIPPDVFGKAVRQIVLAGAIAALAALALAFISRAGK